MHDTYKSWKDTNLNYRIDKIQTLAKLLEIKKEGLAFTISMEMGKPIKESRAEIEKCIWVCHYYCENIDQFLRKQYVATEATESYISS